MDDEWLSPNRNDRHHLLKSVRLSWRTDNIWIIQYKVSAFYNSSGCTNTISANASVITVWWTQGDPETASYGASLNYPYTWLDCIEPTFHPHDHHISVLVNATAKLTCISQILQRIANIYCGMCSKCKIRRQVHLCKWTILRVINLL